RGRRRRHPSATRAIRPGTPVPPQGAARPGPVPLRERAQPGLSYMLPSTTHRGAKAPLTAEPSAARRHTPGTPTTDDEGREERNCKRTGWGDSRKTGAVLQQPVGKDFGGAQGVRGRSNNLQGKKEGHGNPEASVAELIRSRASGRRLEHKAEHHLRDAHEAGLDAGLAEVRVAEVVA